MDLHERLDKVTGELAYLQEVLGEDPEPARVELALSIAKRGRRELTLLIRALAEERDNNATA